VGSSEESWESRENPGTIRTSVALMMVTEMLTDRS
jgi:hypothetical protein